MWLFTRYGFFSTVLARAQDGAIRSLDPETVMVRARVRRHLENVRTRFPDLANLAILDTPGADYACRLLVPKAIWSRIVQELSDEIDYGNFKDACHRTDAVDDDYVQALHNVWQVHHDLQTRRTHRRRR